jgi:hypothetical protein
MVFVTPDAVAAECVGVRMLSGLIAMIHSGSLCRKGSGMCEASCCSF